MSPFIQSVTVRLQETFNPETLGAIVAEWLANLLVGALVYAMFYVAWLLLRLLLRPFLLRSRLDETTVAFIETVAKFTVLVVGTVSALDAAGIQTSAVLASLGIVGLTVGFAARDALSNLISGLLIFLDRPFVIGDLMEIDDMYGRVDRITLRSTRIITSDGKMLAVPNNEIINKTVASYTNFPHLRLDVRVTVATSQDVDQARQVLLNLVRRDGDYLTSPAPRVVMTQLNDYNVELELQVWLENEQNHVEKRTELREQTYKALSQAGVHMPFETIRLTGIGEA